VQEQVVKRVVIAGGGTAGWAVAAALVKQLGKLIEITLVESDAIGTVGVGESTIPTARSFHELLGLNERDFVCATQASFKLGIAFENWARESDRYFHSFGQIGPSTWMADFQHMWLQARELGVAGELGEYCFELQAAEVLRGKGFAPQLRLPSRRDRLRPVPARLRRAARRAAGRRQDRASSAGGRKRLHRGPGAGIGRSSRR
jgi:hypothetical protein